MNRSLSCLFNNVNDRPASSDVMTRFVSFFTKKKNETTCDVQIMSTATFETKDCRAFLQDVSCKTYYSGVRSSEKKMAELRPVK